MRKLFKLKKDFAGKKVGDILEMEDTEAKSLVESGILEDAGEAIEGSILTKAIEGLAGSIATAVKDATTAAVAEATKAVQVHITPGAAEADKTKSFSDNVKHILRAQKQRDRDSWERLDKVYGGAKGFDEDGRVIVRTLESAVGGNGGFLIAPEYSSELLRIPSESAVFAPYVRPTTMSSETKIFPALIQTKTPVSPDASPIHSGIRIYRKSEKAKRTGSQPEFEQIELKATDMIGYTEATRDLLAEAPGFESDLKGMFTDAMGWKQDWEFLWADGVGKPIGALNAKNTSLVTVQRATANQFQYADALNMVSRVLMAFGLKNCYWLMSQTVLPQLGRMKDDNGNAVWISNNGGAQGDLPQSLLGLPVRFSEKMPPLGTRGDVNLVCPKAYIHGVRQGIEIGVSEDFKFDEDLTAFRFKLRNDGQPGLKGPLKLAENRTSNNTTVSPFIQLTDAA